MRGALGIGAAAVAVWLVPASVHIVRWTDAGPQRLALFASRNLLVALVVLGVVAGAALWRAGQLHRRAFAWLSLLWLWAVPYLPWLPDRFPLLLVLAGPLRWLVALVALWGAIATLRRPHAAVFPRTDIVGRRLIFAMSLTAYVIFGALHARAIGPGGDEPHYLIIAHSLMTDGDLEIENNHTERDYQGFWGGPPLRPDYMKRGLNGAIYSIHAPGLPLLVLPVYAIAGYGGVVAFLCLLAALTALAVFDLAQAIAGTRAALLTWMAVCLTVPFVPHAWLIYPELPGALIVAWAALWLWRAGDEDRVSTWLVRGSVLAILPWLHTKFIIFLAVFGGALGLRLLRRPRAAAALGAPMAASVALWLISFYVIYGSFNPEAPYGDYPRMFVLMRNIPRGLLGLLFDQKFGLLMYAPVYLAALAGSWLLFRRAEWRWLGAVLALATAAHIGSTTRLYMWWGGNSAPARFLLPILPCLAPAIAVAVARLQSLWTRALFAAALTVSVSIAVGGLLDPRRLLLFSDPRGKGRLIELLQGPAPLSHLLPTFAQEDWTGPLIALLPWLGAAAATLGAVAAVRKRTTLDPTTLSVVAVAALFLLSTASVLATRVPADGRQETATRGAMAVLWRYDPQRLRPFDYQKLARVGQDAVFDLSTVSAPLAAGAAESSQRIMAGPLSLPAGSYQARVWLAEGPVHDGEVVIAASDRAVFARQGKGTDNPVTVPFQLPVAVRRLTVAASGSLARHAVQVDLRPMAIVAPGDRERGAVRELEGIPEHPGAFVAYLNEHAYPEGGVFWTRGTGEASVLVAVNGARRLALTLFSGAAATDCTVTLDGGPQKVPMTPRQTSTVSFVIPPGQRLVPLKVQASAFFRPSEVDQASTDTRGLGCQVRIGLE
jgi:hypothetical protein